MPKPTTAASGAAALPMHVVLVTMDGHLASAAARAHRTLRKLMPGLRLSVHAAAAWGDDSAGQLGLGRTLTVTAPVTVSGIANVARVSSGVRHTSHTRNSRSCGHCSPLVPVGR